MRLNSRVTWAISAFLAGAMLTTVGCGEETPVPPHEGGSATSDPRPSEGKAAPKIASVRNKGVTRTKAKGLKDNLSKHGLAFYQSLGEIAKAGKVDHPTTGSAHMEKGGGGLAGGAPAPRAMMKRAGGARASMPGGAMLSDKVGITTGGMQDIGQARKIVGEGRVPSPNMFSPEGLLSEHDIPLDGIPSGESDLYASASAAWARRYGEKQPVAVVQLGFGVDMDLDAFRRPALNLAVVVDVSGSMRGGKMEATKTALGKLLSQLNEGDRLAVVLFNNSAWVPLPSEVLNADGLERAKKVVSEIHAGGGTSIESGLKLGYEQIAAHLGEPGRSARVMLLTDARPNVGATAAGGFQPMMEGAAAQGIGLSAFGVGLDFGQDLAYKIFQVRGANYFYLEDEKKIAKVFDDEFDFMVTPAAYDVRIMMIPTPGAEIVDVLGVPDYKKGVEGAELRIPSLFFSKRQGGGATMVAIRLPNPDFAKEVDVATVDLSFLPVGETEKVMQRIEVYLQAGLDPEGKRPFYSQPGAKKALMLADAVVAFRAACHGQRAPFPQEALWTIGEVTHGNVPAPGGRRAPIDPRRAMPRPGDLEITLTAEQAKRAAAGLGSFADWFAAESSGLPALETELRLMEGLEATLRKVAGMETQAEKRTIPEEAGPPSSPPEMDVF